MEDYKKIIKLLLLGLSLTALLLAGCNTKLAKLKETKPLIPMKEYEKMLLGNLVADYIGNENCLKRCHTHDKLAADFNASTMGDQLKDASHGMMIVDCESCHGPASELMVEMEGLDEVKNRDDVIESHKSNLLNYKTLPAGAKSLVCLKCHTQNAEFNLHNWNAGAHALSEVSCVDCHNVHAGSDLITDPRHITDLCLKCHQAISAEFSMPSHHPLKEKKLYCTDCHEPHGSPNGKLLRKMTQKETCGRCHTEKAGPYLYEHGDVTEKCTNCHMPHGAITNNLLKLREPFLCKQCHPHHRNGNDVADAQSLLADRAERYTRCTDCHSMVHGSDTPGTSSGGAFTL